MELIISRRHRLQGEVAKSVCCAVLVLKMAFGLASANLAC